MVGRLKSEKGGNNCDFVRERKDGRSEGGANREMGAGR